ncbi:hypothetical protein CSKR_201700, partial [Clonorchis sinensis]
HSAGPSAGSPAGETVGSEKRQYSSDRPASARIDWDRIDWESLDASSNPFSLSSNVQKSETSEKMEQSSGGQAELVTKPVEHSATEEAESLLTKTESRVKATGGILTKISIDTEHEKSGQDCGIQNVSSAEHFDQSLAEKDKVKIDSELVLEGAPAVDTHSPKRETDRSPPIPRGGDNIDPLRSKVVNAEPKTLNYEANTLENEKRSDLENMAAIGTAIQQTDIHTVPIEDKEHKNADYPNENPACREPEDASTSGTTNTTEQRSEFSPPLPRGDWENSDEFSDTSGGKVTKSLPKDSEDMPSPGTDGAEDQGGKYSNEKTGKTSQRKTNSKTDNKDPSTQKPETETENVNDTASRADERKSLDQTALSPPLPGGEYKIDFDNLDEYSDPFGGKITNKMAKPSAPKSNDPGKESKDQHIDKTSGPSEMGNAPKARKMQEKSENPTLENPVQEKSNAGSTNDAEKSEEKTELSPPLPRGEYKLDFDNLDEYSDPFGGKVTNTITRPSVEKPKDGGEETNSPRDDKSSEPTKVKGAPKGKAKQPKTNNRKSESPMQEKINTASTNDAKKTEEQTELSPPLPRGEYKLDFDNLDEYSDPFGGKLTNTNAKPSVPKSKDVDEEMKSPRDDHSSKSTKVEDALKGKAKQPNTKNPQTETESAVQEKSNIGSTNDAEKSEEQIELSPPLPRGEYKIDFDNLDEYSDPFGGKVTNTTKKSSVVKSKEVGDEMETQRGDKSSKSAKVEGAPKGKQPKQPNTKNPTSEAPVQSQSNTVSTNGAEKSEEQTVVSPPLPRGEYKLDFDNLDEYSDPFGGKVTSTMTKPSVSKPKDGGEETNSPRDDNSSKSTKVESAPKGKAKQPNTTNRTPEVLAANKTGSSPKERLENEAMDDRPLKGGGAYNIDWDAVSEMANPFDKEFSTAPTKTPVKVDSKGDCPADSPNAVTRSPAKSGFKPATPVRTSSVPKPPASVPPSDQSSPLQNGTGPEANSTGNSSAQNGFSLEEGDLPKPKPTPNSAPSPEELAEALEQAALSGNTAPTNSDWPDATQVSQSSDTSYTQPTPGDQAVHPNQVLTKIDSSTRPASPAQPLLHRPSMDDELDNSARFDTPVTESEVISLRKERDELVKTIDEMQRCIAEYDRSLQHMIAEKSQGQAQVNVSVADLISERDQAVEEVATIEKAFGDLHRRFEKSKQVIEGFKQNEEALKRSIEEYKNLLQRQETKYLALKKHAEEKLLKVTQDTEAAKQEAESNATRLQASLRMMEVQVKGLEAQLEQKKRENAELTKICEELLSKYSSGAP